MAGLVRAMGVVFLASVASPHDAEFKLVVQESNGMESITRAEASQFFLKQTKVWPNGEAVAPVDQAEVSAVRKAFSKAVLKKDMGAVRGYWQAQIFSGRAMPAPERHSDASVLAFVRSTAGAIGYVSSSAEVGPGVKEIKLR
jgi:ABC-type phosphate transport system substrate-binding protein